MLNRRDFLKRSTIAGLAAQAVSQTGFGASGLPTRVLGRTGERVSILCLGGWHVGAIEDEKEAIRFMHTAVGEGLTFFDNAWEYHSGRAEEVMGKALAQDGYRKKVFLMTKCCGRDYKEAKQHLEDSLRRLRTDVIDLWQFHEVNYDSDPDWIFERGALRAAIEARKEGKIRFIGFTGHKDPRIHLKMLSKPFDWDTAQMPINVLDAHYRSFQKEVVPVCLKKNVGVIGMKGLAGGYPQGKLVAGAGLNAVECYRYCLSLPVASQVVGVSNMDQLRQCVEMARGFQPMTEEEKSKLLAQVKDVAGDGRFELFKSTQAFDSPVHRRQHGFSAD